MDGVLLGTEKGTGKEIYISPKARRLGSYMVGKQGMGKTNLLTQIALQDIKNGHGMCILSPYPDLIDEILKRIPETRQDDVIIFSPFDAKPLGVNVFEWDETTPITDLVDLVADQVVFGIFNQLWNYSWGPRMELLMKMTARTIFRAQSLPLVKRPTLREFAEVVGFEQKPEYREHLLDHLAQGKQDSTLKSLMMYWQSLDWSNDREFREHTLSTITKAEEFASNRFLAHVLGQRKSGLDFVSVMNQRKILLCDLNVSRLGEGNVGVLGSLIVGRLYLSGKQLEITGAEATTTPFHVIADEFRLFATSAFAKLQDELRKFNIDILVAHQRRGQLSDEMKDATKTSQNWIVFNVNPDDARELAEGFDSTPTASFARKQQEYILATSPWDELKKQAHENQQVLDIVHELETLFHTRWFAGEDLIDEFFRLAHDVLRRKSKKRKDFQHLFDERREVFKMVSVSQVQSPSRISNLNRYLYLRISKRDDEANTILEQLCSRLFWPSLMQQESRFLPIENDLPVIRVDSVREDILTPVALIVAKMICLGNFWDGMTDIERAKWLSLMLAYQMSFNLRPLVIQLGNLLEEQPLYIRGGEPIEDDHSRTFSDVTEEWKNRFAHLEQYEAWVRIQVDRRITECHIETKEAEETPVSAENQAQQLRQQSQDRYGISRERIEEQIQRRTQFGDDDLSLVEDLSDPSV